MLTELRVVDLGIVEELTVELASGLTAITGETGAGKTLLIEGLELLLGRRADPGLVRDGAREARVEGRFVLGGEEIVLARVLPVEGRSRAYIDGRLATAGELAELGATLVDLHSQNGHQSLLAGPVQRAALDRFAGEAAARPLSALGAARRAAREARARLGELGGDEHARAREIDLLRFQISEIDGAAIGDLDEEITLAVEEERLADAAAAREALAAAYAAVEELATEALGSAVASLAPRPSLRELAERARAVQAEVAELGRELRIAADGIAEDPERLDAIRARRALLRQLRRKYGDTLADVVAFRAAAATRLDDLVGHEARAAELARQADRSDADAVAAASELSAARHAAAAALGGAVTRYLRQLAMPRAVMSVAVEPGDLTDDGADAVTFLLAANPGEPARPLARAASGGELARAMLALRLVLSDAPPTLVFDEVDAGIGGEAGTAVGRLLAALARTRQVLCVTHLAQVAAFADTQLAVEKKTVRGRTVATAERVEGDARVRELSRMLAGVEASSHAQQHAAELLAAARQPRRSNP